MKKPKRSQQKIITKQAKILRFMRMAKGISMREAGRLNDLSASAVNHYEQGRMAISEERIRQFVESYGYALSEFQEYEGGKALPVLNIKDECFCLIDRLDDTKLRAVHAFLTSFAN